MQCRVTIGGARWATATDAETGKEVMDPATGKPLRTHEALEGRTTEGREKFLRTPLPWRVMRRWAQGKGSTLAYDGAEICWFPSAAAAAVAIAPEEGSHHFVSVKRDCDEDDPDADR